MTSQSLLFTPSESSQPPGQAIDEPQKRDFEISDVVYPVEALSVQHQAEALISQAEFQVRLNNFPVALNDMNECLKFHSSEAAYRLRAHIFLKLRCYDEALADLTFFPNDPLSKKMRLQVLRARAVDYFSQHQWQKAIDDVQSFLPLTVSVNFFDDVKLLVKSFIKITDFDAALLWLKKIPEEHQVVLKIEIFRARGEQRFLNQNYQGAFSDINEFIYLKPCCFAYRRRAEIHLALGRYPKALEDCARALSFEKNNPLVLVVRAKAHFHLDRYREALDDLQKIAGNDVDLIMLCGRSCLGLQRGDEAANYFLRAQRLRPCDHSIFRWLGEAKMLLGKPQEAFWDFQRALELKPADLFSLLGRGSANLKLEKNEAAAIDFEAVLQQQKGHAVAKAQLELARKRRVENFSEEPVFKRARHG